MVNREELGSALSILKSYGRARNRKVDREPRFVEITDDEAVAILDYIKELENG